ncbi:hypothetical protein [Nonomuraea sp. B19D2]|uniref:hypothetical protein n=1 Tax=Nonomuraea sp. B19D2 TaxID=3159561 RepID=UPI0032DA7DB5
MATGKRERLQIAPGVVPAPGGEDQYNKATIQNLLQDTSPAMISDVGFAYMHAASAIKDACAALKAQAQVLAGVWKGPDATQVQEALRMLYSTGMEISTKMDRMSTGVRTYAETNLPEAISKVNAINVNPGASGQEGAAGGVSGYSTSQQAEQAADQQAANAAAEEENRQAREALRTLNGELNSIWAAHIPVDIEVDLPVINLGAGDGHDPANPYGGRRPGDIVVGGSGSGNSGGNSDSAGGGYRGGNTGHYDDTTGGDQRGDRPGGPDERGEDDRGTGNGTDQPGKDDQTNQPGDQTPGDQTPGDQTPGDQTPGDQPPGDQDDRGNGGPDSRQQGDTVPPVIGQDEQQHTRLGDTDGQIDPNRTENVGYDPTISQTTSTPNQNTMTTRPTTPAITPTTNGPVTVIGEPMSGRPAAIPSAAMRGSGATPFLGMPYAPLGHAGMIGEEGEELVRTVSLPQDRSIWDPQLDEHTPVSDTIR